MFSNDGVRDLSVLVANDDPAILIVLETILKNQIGIGTVEKAANGEDVFQKATSHHFDAIIMDLNMPIVSGFEATANIKEFYEKQQGIPRPYIVALSASEFDSKLV